MEADANVEYGRIVVRPTPVLAWVVVGAVALVAFFGTRPISLGPVLAVVGLIAFDIGLSARRLRAASFDASIESLRVTTSEPFVVTLGSPSGADLLLRPLGLGFDKVPDSEPWTVLPRRSDRIDLHFPVGAVGIGASLRWLVSTSVLGFVLASRLDAIRPPRPLIRTPEPLECEIPVFGRDPRSQLREYRPGDRPSAVSWTATARTGQLHVLDSTESGYEEVQVVVEILAANDAAEIGEVLGRAAHVLESLIVQGATVRLRTLGVAPATLESEVIAYWKAGTEPTERILGRVSQRNDLLVNREDIFQRLALIAEGSVDRPPESHTSIGASGVEVVA